MSYSMACRAAYKRGVRLALAAQEPDFQYTGKFQPCVKPPHHLIEAYESEGERWAFVTGWWNAVGSAPAFHAPAPLDS